jgi:hypothetical protein
MSQENVEVVRRYLSELADLPEPLPEWVVTYWESDADYYPVRKLPEARPCHGHEEIEEFVRNYLQAWERYDYEVRDVRAIDEHRVFAQARIRAEGRESGVTLQGDVYHCFWLRHGRFLRVEDHLTPRGALHALGLSEAAISEAAGLRE